MTGSAVQERRGKMERLISAAAELLYRQGAQATTLAAIAEAADVPSGNVYYYFKTRDDLVRAVVDARAREIWTVLDALGKRPNPCSRLKALARTWSDQRDLVAESGCAIEFSNPRPVLPHHRRKPRGSRGRRPLLRLAQR
jgi:TetR/AcrR family transcriptional repressor of nem operon